MQELSGAVRPFYRKESGINFHIDTLTLLCDAYGVTVPGDRAGEYTVLPETVQEAVEAVYKAARESLLMYETFLTGTLPADVRSAFVYLRNAASRHVAMLAYSQEADSIWYGSGRRTAPQYRQQLRSIDSRLLLLLLGGEPAGTTGMALLGGKAGGYPVRIFVPAEFRRPSCLNTGIRQGDRNPPVQYG